ncbi:MAG: P-loop NTPase [Bacillota bacterium]
MAEGMDFFVGQTLYITPHSSVYRGPYQTTILETTPEGLVVELPYHQGKIVLLSVGTAVTVASGDQQYQAQIVDRRLRSSPSIKLTFPHSVTAQVRRPPRRGARVIAVTSGKGGVGKTSLTINLAINLARQGKRVALLDADLGTANIDVLLGMNPRYNLIHVVSGEKILPEVMIEGPEGIQVIPGGPGLQELANLSELQFSQLLSGFSQLEEFVDILLIDTGAGISKNVTNFLLAADDILVVTTPEPHAMLDAYAVIKVIRDQHPEGISLVMNRCEERREGEDATRKLMAAIERFLGVRVEHIYYLMDDPAVTQAIKAQVPVSIKYPSSRSAREIAALAARLLESEKEREAEKSATERQPSFLERLWRLVGVG